MDSRRLSHFCWALRGPIKNCLRPLGCCETYWLEIPRSRYVMTKPNSAGASWILCWPPGEQGFRTCRTTLQVRRALTSRLARFCERELLRRARTSPVRQSNAVAALDDTDDECVGFHSDDVDAAYRSSSQELQVAS